MNNDIALAFMASSKHQIDHARDKINHCLDQLRTEDVWWTPRDGCNPIGVIIQHLMGNLRQWALSAIGGEPDVRDRPSEFDVVERVPKDTLQAEFNGVLGRVKEIYSRISVSDLLAPKRIQGFDTMTLGAIYDTLCHLQLHTGQVLYLTRLRLGDAYAESWIPATGEQSKTEPPRIGRTATRSEHVKWKGVLIAESLESDRGIWDRVEVTGRSKGRLEREGSRGEFTFCNVEVSEGDVDSLMRAVAGRLASPGWYFHVEKDRVIKVAYPGKVMEMSEKEPESIRAARQYGVSIGIHPEQLCFERFMGNPFDQ